MSIETDKIGAALFEKLRARFDKISVGDEQAKKTVDPDKARFFNFDYLDDQGNNFGNVSINLVDDGCLKIYYGKNITAELDEEQKAEWFNFLRDLRMFAKRNMLSFDTRDISRSMLRISDLKQTAKADSNLTVNDIDQVIESAMYGTKKISYKQVTPECRLRVIHSQPINDDIHGARARKIHAVYVETNEGERIKLPTNNLRACAALARHHVNSGHHSDAFGKHILDLVQEKDKLRGFIRGTKNKTFEDADATDMIESAKCRYNDIGATLGKLGGPRGYKFYKESWKPAETLQDDIDLEYLRNKFVTKTFDERLTDALPHVVTAYNKTKELQEDDMNDIKLEEVDEFEQWANNIVEGTWSLPTSDESINELQEIMSKPLLAGVDGTNAIAALDDLIGDDDLSDDIYNASKGSSEVDVRPVVMHWLEEHLPDIAKQVSVNMDSAEEHPDEPAPEPEPEMEEPPQQEPVDPAAQMPDPNQQAQPPAQDTQLPSADDVAAQMPDPNQQPQEESEDLSQLRRLAGIR